MDVLAIILACSLHPDDQLVRALVAIQSRDNVNFVGDLATLKTNDTLGSPEAALRFARDLESHGGRPAVGLLGVPLAWAERYGLPPRALFDACTNIAVGTAALDGYGAACAAQGSKPRHSLAASHARKRRRTMSEAPRVCLLDAFAKDLGLIGSAAAVLARLPPVPSIPAPTDDEPNPSLFSPVFPEGTPPGAEEALRSTVFLPGPPLGRAAP